MIGLSLSRGALGREAHDLDAASVFYRERAAVALVEKPLRGVDIECVFGADVNGVIDARIDQGLHDVETHDVRRAADGHLYGAQTTDTPLGDRQRDNNRVLQRGRIGPGRREIVSDDQLARDITQRGVHAVQLDRRARSIGRHDWLSIAPIATRQQADELQEALEMVGLNAQHVRRPLVDLVRQFDHMRDGRNRRNAITEHVCQAAEQFVMYSKPARRALAAARG